MPATITLLLLLGFDAGIVYLSQTFTLLLLGQSYHNLITPSVATLGFITMSIGIGFYKLSISHVGISAVGLALFASIAVGLILFLLEGSIELAVFASMMSLIGVIGYRVISREFLFRKRHSSAVKTLVYGAGSAGVQFVTASMQGDTHNVVGYIDDNPDLCGTSIHGRKVFSSKHIETLIARYEVQVIVLAMPSINKKARKRIVDSLVPLSVRLVSVPTFDDIIEGNQRITRTEEVSIEDLLGRDPVPPIEHYLQACTYGKICLVTGAGGSIGSELCRQIVRSKPKHLVLLDISEPALFAIEQEILRSDFLEITCRLGSVVDQGFIAQVFSEHNIDCVYHTAAYKHVPMVEANPMAGVINNVLGTQIVVNAAIDHKCESFTLISTDKAVRPTNIMGATKRLAEISCQLASEANLGPTVISLVRFGNVLGSSGSVVPTFQRQIRHGGPVTLTHADVTRYFMTIAEAAQLVIQAAGMADSGDLFLLDMGEPVKIFDLAERLIRLSGKTVKLNEKSLDTGAIEIKVTGLRPGEKLYEELLVTGEAQPTAHPKIMRAREQYISREAFELGLEELLEHLNHSDIINFKLKLSELVVGYKAPGSRIAQDA